MAIQMQIKFDQWIQIPLRKLHMLEGNCTADLMALAVCSDRAFIEMPS